MTVDGMDRTIPVRRVIEKMNEHMSRLDYDAAERHLKYWLSEARALGDRRGELTVLNELIGHARKTDQRELAEQSAKAALRPVDEPQLDNSETEGTTCINIATACCVFGEYEASLRMFSRAEAAYRQMKEQDPWKMGGLYNNMGLTLTALKRYDEAMAAYRQALQWMGSVPDGAPEQAETCLNMANTLEYQFGAVEAEKEIAALLDRAEALLDTPGLTKDGYYAYILDHCAPTFEHYGYFLTAQRLRNWTKDYYERT